MEPKQMLVALYHGTKTLENVEKNKAGLLQLLPESLATVVRTCGQESGHATDKIARLQKRFELQYYNGWPYFALAAGYLELDFVNLIETGGDHTLGVATVKTHKNLHDVPILTTDYLKLHKFTR
jgi:flavin reductase (DIM6/NTAB) family NADH-FMN oxidoreductase RutF